jgi:Zn finger protein HypA/HybF involved in hydrogenase expression
MHEAGIAQGLLEAAINALPTEGRERMKIVRLTVAAGVLAGVEKECLTMYLDQLAKGTQVQGAALEMKILPAWLVCRECGNRVEFDSAGPVQVRCEKCGGPNELQGGRDEIVLESMEVETK